MISFRFIAATVVVLAAETAGAAGVADLRLIPFPKQIDVQPGSFSLSGKLVLESPAADAELLGRLIGGELRRAGLPAPEVRATEGKDYFFRLTADGNRVVPLIGFRAGATAEDYALVVQPGGVHAAAPGREGLFCAAQTVCQLIRANRGPGGISCLTIHDWPSLRWRSFLDDMTRGPSATLDTLRREVDLGAALKMNLFTYYMEYQFAFGKHPTIGPKDGSLEPRELAALVSYAKPLGMDILGNQQSFGHFGAILAHSEFAAARETGDVLSPVKEETYKLLDDLYAEELPLLPFPWFNVCCDETAGLGSGPSKNLAAKIGVGGVYVRHVCRLHDLLKKYHKRMMMWGDIILQHPDKLDQIPKDTIMLTWAYDPRASFDNQILPFARSGYQFFVCPGVDDWSRILPNFDEAALNIRNFVRDGVKHHALGMLNTDWKDDGETLRGCNWHGYAWGAECAWNASQTSPEVFNRRLGGVLFGEKGDHFGHAIELLAQTHKLPGMNGMMNGRFWQNDFPPGGDPAAVRISARRLLATVRPAIEHLVICKKEAVANADLLDSFLLGARRMERIGQRMLDGLACAEAYREACTATDKETALRFLATADKARAEQSRSPRSAGPRVRAALAGREQTLLAETGHGSLCGRRLRGFDALQRHLAGARQNAEAGQPLPSPEETGLDPPQGFVRRTQAQKIVPGPLEPEAPWAEPAATHRLGLTVRRRERRSLRRARRAGRPLARRTCGQAGAGVPPDGRRRTRRDPRPARPLGPAGQGPAGAAAPRRVDQGDGGDGPRLPGSCASPPALPQAASTTPGPKGMKWIENDRVRLLLGPEGGHVYRWEVKALE